MSSLDWKQVLCNYGINTFKNNSCSPLRSSCWKSNVFFQSMFSFKRSLTQSPRHDATSPAAGSQHETANALGLTATSRLMTLLRRATFFFLIIFQFFQKNFRKLISLLLDFFTSLFTSPLLYYVIFQKMFFSFFRIFIFFKKIVFSTKFTILKLLLIYVGFIYYYFLVSAFFSLLFSFYLFFQLCTFTFSFYF